MTKILWIDMEMTGLDVEKEAIIEVAAIVTDLNFQQLDTYETVVKQDQKFIDAMDDWNKKQHTLSGLIKSIPWGKPESEVEDDLLKILDRYFPGERAVIAGNSIMQDRLFINKNLKRFADRLHYRMLDVTSWKVILNHKFNIKYDKKNSHRALDDIRESISELQFYIDQLKQKKD
jgi:oligoribonuclease